MKKVELVNKKLIVKKNIEKLAFKKDEKPFLKSRLFDTNRLRRREKKNALRQNRNDFGIYFEVTAPFLDTGNGIKFRQHPRRSAHVKTVGIRSIDQQFLAVLGSFEYELSHLTKVTKKPRSEIEATNFYLKGN